ncbi:radical SAM protein [Streptomyces sp. NPDC014623]|uniref:radical SAM protein n=1 Tax=Streptomyces sp. NPDC014623 TaxID=3364875 RepID=UPI0036FAFD6B
MELGELVGRRPFPAAGLLLGLTRRCPLSCAHCSTGSSLTAREEPGAGRLLDFVGSFTEENRPDVVMLTGGEPLLLPALVAELSTRARAAGSRTALLSGMFFARSRDIPPPLLRAITGVDHFSASLDAHHEREVPRSDVFRAVHRIRAAGVPVSFHLAGTGADDPYLADITRDIEEEFGGRVPSLVNEVRPFGRAASWAAPARTGPEAGAASPCAMAAWPVVAFDGTVLACCNQDTVDRRPAPAHLRLGHIATDDWATVRRRALESPVLRMIRTVGPAHLAARSGASSHGASYCDGCRALGSDARVAAEAGSVAAGAPGALLDLAAAHRGAAQGPVGVVRRHGCAAYAPLVLAGAPVTDAVPAAEGPR